MDKKQLEKELKKLKKRVKELEEKPTGTCKPSLWDIAPDIAGEHP